MVLPWEELSLPAVRMPARYNSMFGCAVFCYVNTKDVKVENIHFMHMTPINYSPHTRCCKHEFFIRLPLTVTAPWRYAPKVRTHLTPNLHIIVVNHMSFRLSAAPERKRFPWPLDANNAEPAGQSSWGKQSTTHRREKHIPTQHVWNTTLTMANPNRKLQNVKRLRLLAS